MSIHTRVAAAVLLFSCAGAALSAELSALVTEALKPATMPGPVPRL